MRQRRDKRYRKNYLLDDLKIISKVLSVFILILLIVFIFSSIKMKNKSMYKISNTTNNEQEINLNEEDANIPSNLDENLNSSNETVIPKKEEIKNTTINMAFTGDIMCHNTIYNDAYNKETESYDFSYIFDNIKYYIQTADIAIGNLETTFAGAEKGYSSYPKFNSPEILAYNLKKLGFDVVSTANNHCYDKGYSGIESTINFLDEADLSHTGTYTSEENQNKILIKNVKGIQIAFLSFTYGTNGITISSDKSYSVNLIDKDLIKRQLDLAKEQNPDIICVSMHWGQEYQTSPNNNQKDLADFLFQNGADIIIGNHPHVLQPMEKREISLNDGTTKEGFIVYSLGNFLADQSKTNTRNSAILNLKITKDQENKIHINTATYTPIYTYKDSSQSTKKFKIIDLKNTIASYEAGYDTSLSATTYQTFKKELENVDKVLGN